MIGEGSLRLIRGRRTFVAASAALLFFGAVHVLRIYTDNFAPPRTLQEAELRAMMKSFGVPFGNLFPTAWGANQILSASYSILLIWTGTLNLLLLRAAATAGLLRTLTRVNVIFIGLVLIVTIYWEFPPPMLFAGIVFLLFLASLMRQAPRPAPPARELNRLDEGQQILHRPTDHRPPAQDSDRPL